MLLNAGVRFGGGPMRTMGGATAGAIERARWGESGNLRNFHAGQATLSGASAKAGYPSGGLHPNSWSLPNKPGGMSSRFEAGISIGASGLAVGGVNISGASGLSFAATGAGRLIAFGQGTASLLFGASGTMAGTVQASGSASFTIASNAPVLGALASGSGTASMTFSAAADILPANDTPPARSATASFSITGSATLRAIGFMSGSTDVASERTASGIAAEVLAAAASSPIAANIERVRGQGLQGTGNEGTPWGPA